MQFFVDLGLVVEETPICFCYLADSSCSRPYTLFCPAVLQNILCETSAAVTVHTFYSHFYSAS